MLAVPTSSRMPLVAVIGAIALAISLAACGFDPVIDPSSEATPPPVAASGSPRPSSTISPDASGGPAPSSSPGAPSASPDDGPPASVEPFTPPPEMEPLDDETCLELASRSLVEATLGLVIGDISAEGTDPTIALTCTYPAAAGGGRLLLTTAAEDPGAYDTEVAVATSYGQDPQPLDGIGDQAFYGAATAAAPEQIVFTKGPIIVRLWNQTEVTIGRPDFEALASAVADAIHAEIPPVP